MNRKVMFSPSLMCMDLLNVEAQMKILDKVCDIYHVDVMDGSYVKNFSLSPMFVEQIKPLASKPIDMHLMVLNPQDYLEACAKAGATFISPHCDRITKDAFRVINTIKELGCKAGVALNPSEPLEMIKHYINRLDKITIMTVDPGFAGQKFVPETLDKVKELVKLRKENGYNYLIEVDGSCNKNTFKILTEAGVDVLIVGSSGLFKYSDDLNEAWDMMLKEYDNCLSK